MKTELMQNVVRKYVQRSGNWTWSELVAEAARVCFDRPDASVCHRVVAAAAAHLHHASQGRKRVGRIDTKNEKQVATSVEQLLMQEIDRADKMPQPQLTAEALALAEAVFQVFSERLVSRSADIVEFCRTQNSFEDWCNWESFSACRIIGDWKAIAKPTYGCSLRSDYPSAWQGDLCIAQRYNGSIVVVEFGLVHDGTKDIWQCKLNRDEEKLCFPFKPHVVPLQVQILTTTKTTDFCSDRAAWLRPIRCWSRAPDMRRSVALAPMGQMVIAGWVVRAKELNAVVNDLNRTEIRPSTL